MIEHPVLLLIFNRPEKVKELIDAIRPFQPQIIYVGADGPRDEKERIQTECARQLIELNIDWKCKIKRLYRDQNLGLRQAVSQAISWFFAAEEMGIILEDDCVPTEGFFEFMDEMLCMYKDNPRILHISGSSLLNGKQNTYHLSKYPRVWGWATWRRAWNFYDDSTCFLEKLNKKILREMYPRKIDYAFWSLIVDKMKLYNSSMRKKSWAYFWALNIRYNQALCIQPYQNLIFNNGFSESATNTWKRDRLERLSQIVQPSDNKKRPFVTSLSDKIDEEMDRLFVDKILIDSNLNYLKVLIKIAMPFLKPKK